MIKLIGFDLDNTLWPVKPVILHAEAELQKHLSALSPAIPYSGAHLTAYRTEILEKNPDFAFRLTDLRRALLVKIAMDVPAHRSNAEAVAEAAMTVFLKARNAVSFYPGAEEALQTLSQDFALCALTNGNASVDQLSIGPLFKFALTAEQVGAPKPQPDLFLAALDRFGCRPEEMIYVGDDPLLDVTAAASLGIFTIWLSTPEKVSTQASTPATEIIYDLSELEKTVTRINDRSGRPL